MNKPTPRLKALNLKDPDNRIRELAKLENRSLPNMVETLVQEALNAREGKKK